MEPSRYNRLVSDAFKELGFLIQAKPANGPKALHLVAERNGRRLAIRVRIALEGRRDRIEALLAQAILEVRLLGKEHGIGTELVAIVVAPRVSYKNAQEAIAFAMKYAPDVASAVFDLGGLRLISAQDLQGLNAEGSPPLRDTATVQLRANLFSDGNQWMLKILLASRLNRPDLLGCPVKDYKRATDLAQAAGMTTMTAFRFLELLRQEGFLDESSSRLRVVRLAELLERWRASYMQPARDLPVRWLLPGKPKDQLPAALHGFGKRACLALFGAANALGLGHVSGAPVYVYVDRLDSDALGRMGVVAAGPGERLDLILRRPAARTSVFGAMVENANGLRCADILQVWLDVSAHPSRGREQADFIYRRVIGPKLVGT